MSQKKSRVDKNKSTKKNKSRIKMTIKIGFIIVLIGILSVGGLFGYYAATAPKIDPDKLDVPSGSELYDKDGEVFASLYDENRKKIEYDDLPQVLIDAVTATEDVRFFEHPGIDIRRIGGAVLANIKRGFGAEGASTITQQVVENFFLTPDKKIKLKVQEQWLALQLERKYSKEEILEMYLNKIFYGGNAYGVAKAAETYFGITDLHDLNLTQAAMLAGLPQRPTAYNPFENPDLMQERVDTVLTLMVRHGKITEEEAAEARKVSVESQLTDKKPRSAPYESFIQEVRKEIEDKLDGADINNDGLKIYTTLDRDAQDYVEFLLTDSEENPMNYPDEDLQSGVTVLDTKTGGILAVGGSRNRENVDGDNYAINLKRQPGSTYKPLLSYAPSIELDKKSTYEQIHDEPYTPKSSDKEIRNVTRQNYGWVSYRYALTNSLNIPAAKLLENLGSDKVKPFAESLGLEFDGNLDPRDAIGGTINTTSPLKLAGAFRAFGNEGFYNEPFAVTKVEYPDGKVVELTPEQEPVMEDYTAYMITDMLQDVITEGTGKAANIPGLKAAGKTGTTNNSVDKWFVGYTTNYTISVWSGYPESNERSVEYSQVSMDLYRHIMTEISKDVETADFKKPDSVVEVNVEKGTNPPALPSEFTPSDKIVTELFVKGTEPKEVSDTFDQLDPVENLEAQFNEDENNITISWDYEADFDVNYKIKYKENDGDYKSFTDTDKTEVTFDKVEEDTTYTFEVVAIDTKNDVESKPATVSVKTPTNEIELPKVSQLNAKYDEETDQVIITWDYNGPPAQFMINVNGNETKIDNRQYTIDNPENNSTYKIVVTPIDDDNNEGPSSEITITVESNDDNNADNGNDNENNDESNNNSNN